MPRESVAFRIPPFCIVVFASVPLPFSVQLLGIITSLETTPFTISVAPLTKLIGDIKFPLDKIVRVS
jgi:hypothetical protein